MESGCEIWNLKFQESLYGMCIEKLNVTEWYHLSCKLKTKILILFMVG